VPVWNCRVLSSDHEENRDLAHCGADSRAGKNVQADGGAYLSSGAQGGNAIPSQRAKEPPPAKNALACSTIRAS